MFGKKYWDNTYIHKQTEWDIGYIATPLKEYFNQLENKHLRILVPGAGNGYEVEYLYHLGFKNVYFLDFAPTCIHQFLKRNPKFPQNQIFEEDFFKHKGQYNIIIEHTFLTTFPKSIRNKYAAKMHELLSENGKLVGLLFNHEFYKDHPPFGGTPAEYMELFHPYFQIKIFKTAYNSIKPRKDRELFINLIKMNS